MDKNLYSFYPRIQRMASSVTTPRYFRFCPLCLKEDLQEYGEAYWHRLHQTPGVLACPVHAIPLSDSIVPIQAAPISPTTDC